MNRRKFIKQSSLGLLSVGIVPNLFFSNLNHNSNYSVEDLIGKSNPQLYGKGYKLRKSAADAFEEMKNAAHKDNINIHVISSYRSFDHQNRIWTRKYNRFLADGLSATNAIKKIILYSTIPGTSRHHWGTDLDIVDSKQGIVNNPLRAKLFNEGNIYYNLKVWLDKFAADFGFYEVYTSNPDRKGFNYEPWHLSFRPLSCEFLTEYTSLDLIKILKENKVKGSENFTQDFIKDYKQYNILDINPNLLP